MSRTDMRVRRLALFAALAVLMVVGIACSEGGFGGEDTGDTGGGTGGDTFVDTDDGDPDPDTDDGEDTFEGDTGVDPDGGQDTGGQQGPKPVEAFTSCGAGGVSQGSGMTAVQCYGPVEASGREASGSGVRWQAGAFRVVSQP